MFQNIFLDFLLYYFIDEPIFNDFFD